MWDCLGPLITHVGEFLRISTESWVPRVRKHLWSMVSKTYRRSLFRLPLWTPEDKTQIQNGVTGSKVSHHQVRAKLCKNRRIRQRELLSSGNRIMEILQLHSRLPPVLTERQPAEPPLVFMAL